MKIHPWTLIAALACASAAQAEESFTYTCAGGTRILPNGLALGKVDWKFDIDPGKKRAGTQGKWVPMEINQYRIAFPLEGKHWISITRANGHFYAVQPIENPDRKMQEYLLHEGTCATTQ